MTDPTPSQMMQLQYCPVCHRLVRPSMLQTHEAVVHEGQTYHSACLAKGKQPSGREQPVGHDFDNEDGAPVDFSNYEKVVVESVTGMRRTKPGTGPQVAMRRKTTSAAISGIAHEPPPARRSSMVLRSYSDAQKKKGSPAILIGVVVGALAALAVGGLVLMNSGSPPPDDSGDLADNGGRTPPSTTRPLPPNPTTTVPPPPAMNTPAPAPPTNPPPPRELTPYELAMQNKDPNGTGTTTPSGTTPTTPAVPATPAADWEPAGPAEALFDGATLAGWTVRKSAPNAVSVKDGAIFVNPGSDPVVIEHSLAYDSYDLTFEARMGSGENGAYMEAWIPRGTLRLTARDFQSTQWTPAKISVRGDAVTGEYGSRGAGKILTAAVQNDTVAGDQAKYMAGKKSLFIFCSSAITKEVRNIQVTPWRAKAAPTPAPESPPTAKGEWVLPITVACDSLSGPLGKWERMQVKSEGNKKYLAWVSPSGKVQEPFFEISDTSKPLPAKVKVKIEYRVRNYPGMPLQLRLYTSPNNRLAHSEFPVAQQNVWLTTEQTIATQPGKLFQFDLRMKGNPGFDVEMEIGSIVFSAVVGDATATVPTVPTAPPLIPTIPTTTPEPAPLVPTPAPALPVPPVATIADQLMAADKLADWGGHWFRMSEEQEAGTAFLRWDTAKEDKFPFFRNEGRKKIPLNSRLKARVRVQKNDNAFIYVRFYVDNHPNFEKTIRLSAPDADGWRICEADIQNDFEDFREFEFKAAGQTTKGMVLDVDSVEIIGPKVAEANPATPVPTTPVTPVPAPTTPVAPVTPSVTPGAPVTPVAAAGATILRLEGVYQEKGIGRWTRASARMVDQRTVVTYSKTTQNSPAFITFENPTDRPMPAKVRVRFAFRFNKPVKSVRLVFGVSGGGEECFLDVPVAGVDVDAWQEREVVFSPNAKMKCEVFMKLGDYPEDLQFDIDWIEILDATQPSVSTTPAGTPAIPGTPVTPGTPGTAVLPGAVPGMVPTGPQPGSRLAAVPAGVKKLTKPDLAVTVSVNTTSSLSQKGMLERLFDGDTAGGIFSLAANDPASKSCWLTIDLGEMRSVSAIKVWNFHSADRTYGSQVWQICPFSDFQRSVVTVYNADSANVHGLGAGSDRSSKAVAAGLTIPFTPVRGRYVRIWCNGNNDNKDNHILEVEVWGSEDVAAFKVPAHLAAGDLRVNTGRAALAGWTTAAPYVRGGTDGTDPAPVTMPKTTLPIPDKLFQTMRSGVMTWSFPKLPDGHYWVRMYFNEKSANVAGGRMFDVVAQGETVLKDYDIFKVAGGQHRGVVETVAVVTAGGKGLTIEFKMVKNTPLLCALEILPTDGPQPPPAKPDVP